MRAGTRDRSTNHPFAQLFALILFSALPLLANGQVEPEYDPTPASEREALITFYEETGGDDWINKSGWKGADPCVGWLGVTCSTTNPRHVTAITLPMNRLTGALPNLTGLPYLQALRLRDNALSGEMPSLPASVTEIQIPGNRMSGPPYTIWSLPNLTILDVTGNQFSGSIPGLPSSVSVLKVASNLFSGTLPTHPAGLTLAAFCYNYLSAGGGDDAAWNSYVVGYAPDYHNWLGCQSSPASPNLQILPPTRFPQDTANAKVTVTSSSPVDKTFSSSDNSVASVDGAGNLTLKTPGTTVITVSQSAVVNYTAATTSATITVSLPCNGSLGPPDYRDWETCHPGQPLPLVPQAEYNALEVLFNATTGAQWRYHSNWLTDPNVCTWGGVTCSWDGERHVSSLDLSNNNLVTPVNASGEATTLLPSLAALTKAAHLDLSHNLLAGPIPALPNSIVTLDLSYNRLSGIPETLWSLTNVTEFNVENNRLTGTIPPLPALTEFKIAINQFSGTLPTHPSDLIRYQVTLCNNYLAGGGGDDAAWTYLNADSPNWVNCQQTPLPANLQIQPPTRFPLDIANPVVTVTTKSIGKKAFSSSDTSVAEVNDAGDLILHQPGTTVITVTQAAHAGYAAATVSATFTVSLPCDGSRGAPADEDWPACHPGQPLPYVPQVEHDALVALFNATDGDGTQTIGGGPGWTIRLNWITDPDVCTWYKVKCSGYGDRHVSVVDLAGNGLRTPRDANGAPKIALPDLTVLPRLTELRLNGNDIESPLPPLPPSLTLLFLNDNKFTGSVESAWALSNLTNLSLSNNKLTGTVGTLPPNLVQFFIEKNQITGTLPTPPVQLVPSGVKICHNQLWAGDSNVDAAWNSLSPGWLTCEDRLPVVLTFPAKTFFTLQDSERSVQVTSTGPAEVRYTSSSVVVADVDNSGMLSPHQYGSTTITASSDEWHNYAATTKTQPIYIVAPCDRDQGRVSGSDLGNCITSEDKHKGSQGCNADGLCSQDGELNAVAGYFTRTWPLASSGGVFPLQVNLTFNSNSRDVRHSFERKLIPQGSGTTAKVTAKRADGKGYTFTQSSGVWVAEADAALALAPDGSGYKLTDLHTDAVESYDNQGRLTSIKPRDGPTQTVDWNDHGLTQTVRDSWGRSMTLKYLQSPSGYLYPQSVTDHAGRTTTFDYNFANTVMPLTTIITADDIEHSYVVTGTNPTYTITENYRSLPKPGVDPEALKPVRTITLAANKIVATALPAVGGIGQAPYTLVYNANGSTLVTDPLNIPRYYGYQIVRGVKKEAWVKQRNGADTADVVATRTYDANGNRISEQDFRGNSTTWTYDLIRNLPTARYDAANVPAVKRSTSYTWHSQWAVPTAINEDGYQTQLTYDSQGRMATRTVTDGTNTQTWNYEHNDVGQVTLIKGPHWTVANPIDITDYSYDPATGQLLTSSNDLGHVTSYTYYTNGGGKGLIQTITAPDGVVTAYTYDVMGRVALKQVANEQTRYEYTPLGNLYKTTLPDGQVITFEYDEAQRLNAIANSAGDRIEYTLDKAGNVTQEIRRETGYDASYLHSRNMNFAINRPKQEKAADGSATTLTYDNEGTLLTRTDPLGHTTTNTYDALSRLLTAKDALNGVTTYAYNRRGLLTSVTDPKGQQTTYTVNGLDQVTSEINPNTGATTLTYDAAGNVISRVDARGVTATMGYDSLNRVTNMSYSGSSGQQVEYAYDSCVNGAGKLCRVTDSSLNTTGNRVVDTETTYTYTSPASGAKVATKTQSAAGGPTLITSYSWSPNPGETASIGKLTAITLPSGIVIRHHYADGKLSSITYGNGTTETSILRDISYDPFGPLGGWAWGDDPGSGNAELRMSDQNYRPSKLIRGPAGSEVTTELTWDSANRLTVIAEGGTTPSTQNFGYDANDRLTSASIPLGTYAWTYDAVGNRLTQGVGGATTNYAYEAGKQRLAATSGATVASYSYDAKGNQTAVTGAGAASFTYNAAGRMATATVGTASLNYVANTLGQRVAKTVISGGPTATTVYTYDEAGHLLGEYDASTGTPMQETVWLDDLPIATIRAGVVYRVYPDHLGTPRRITDTAGNLRWRWDSDPFGTTAPNENPAGLGAFSYNLRFPGQMYDAETGLHHNWHRDYDSKLGRYVQSDPIGLAGGLNEFAYALDAPAMYADRQGLDVKVCFYADAAWIFGHVGFALPEETATKGFYPSSGPSSPGVIKTDQQKKQTCKTLIAKKDQDKCMATCRKTREEKPGDYLLGTRQCTSFVRDCLLECKIIEQSQTTLGPYPKPFFSKLPVTEK